MTINLAIGTRVRESGQAKWDIIGVWAFQVAQSNVADRAVREGGFRARQEPTPLGYVWRIEVMGEERRGNPESRTGPLPKIDTWGTQIGDVHGCEHQDLMAILKSRLKAEYSQLLQVRVLYQQVRPLSLHCRHQNHQPWWRRVWEWAVVARGNPLLVDDHAGMPWDQNPVGSRLYI